MIYLTFRMLLQSSYFIDDEMEARSDFPKRGEDCHLGFSDSLFLLFQRTRVQSLPLASLSASVLMYPNVIVRYSLNGSNTLILELFKC